MKKKFLGVFCSVAMLTSIFAADSAMACTKSWGSQATAAQKGKCAAQTVSVNNANQFKDAVAKAGTLGNCSMTIDLKATIEIDIRINITGCVNLVSSNGSKIKAGKEFCKGGKLHGQSMFNVNKGSMFNIGCSHNVSCDSAWGWGKTCNGQTKVDAKGNCFGQGKVDAKGNCGGQGKVDANGKGNCTGKVDAKTDANGKVDAKTDANAKVDVNVDANANGQAQAGLSGDGSFKAEGNITIDANHCGGCIVSVCDQGQTHIADGAKIENADVIVETPDNANKDQCVNIETKVKVNGKDVAKDNVKETYVKAAKDAKVVNKKADDKAAKATVAPKAKNLDDSPKTGDSSNIWVAVGALVVAAAGIVGFIFMRKRKTV